MAEQNERPAQERTGVGVNAEAPARAEPELAELISAWYVAARARLLARRQPGLPPWQGRQVPPPADGPGH